MKKEETIKMYRDSYLEGRSEEARVAFMAKSVAKQYSCIMAWRHRMRHSQKSTDGSEIIDHLKVARKRLANAGEITKVEVETIGAELDALRSGLAHYVELRKEREIEELERQQMQIMERLRSLKGAEEE